MSDHKSILMRMAEQGRPARRVQLEGGERDDGATERYAILGEIARGGTGVVHKGRDNDLGRDVALKVLREDHLETPEFIERFVEEAQIGGQLQHPGIVPVYELGLRSDQRPYFAMKLVKGETLAAKLATRKDPADGRRKLLAVFREVCRTMAYAHARNVIHRDLKPSNVMIGNFGEVQVVDWGFAKVMRRGGVADERLADKAERDVTMISTVRSGEGSSHSVAGSVMGTPGYMSPEQATGRVDDLDDKSDLFSLGAILCEILTGKPPYTGDEKGRLTAAAQARLEPARTRLASCGADDRLVALCTHCLQALPKDRPANAQRLADDVAAYLRDAESRAHRAQVRAMQAEEHAEAQRRSRRLTTLGGLSAAALLLIAVGGWSWLDHDRTTRVRSRQQAIETALQDASRLRAAARWSEALDAADRAITLGDDGALAATIRAEAAVAEAREQREAEDAALLAELEDTLARRSDEFKSTEADAAFDATIRERWPDFAIDTERLRTSPHALALAAVFDAWAQMRRSSTSLEGSNWRAIDTIARTIDPDHQALRDAMAKDDPTELVEFATSDAVAKLPPALQATIGSALLYAERDDEAATLLRASRRRHPNDVWVIQRLARAAELRKDWAKAVDHFTAALALRPDSIEIRHRLGLAYQKNGDVESAIAVWREAVDRQPDWAHGYMHIADGARALGRLDAAEALYRSRVAVTTDPTAKARAIDNLGAFLSNALERHAEAAACFRDAIALDDGVASVWMNLGIALDKDGQPDAAIEAYRSVLEQSPTPKETAQALRSIGEIYGKLGRPDDARDMYERVLALGHGEAETWNHIGSLERGRGRLAEAAEAFGEAIRADANMVLAYENLGLVLDLRGEYFHAVQADQKAVELGGATVLTHIRLGSTLSDRYQRHEEAFEIFRRGLEIEPDNPALNENMGVTLREMGRLDEAYPYFARALALDDTNARRHVNFGVLHNRMGKLDEAMRLYDKAILMDPELAIAHANRGSTLQRMGRPVEAIVALRLTLHLEPDIPYGFVHRMLALALADTEAFAEAAPSFRKAIGFLPRNAGLRVDYGHTLDQLGRADEALEQNLQATRIDAEHAIAHSNVGNLRMRQGDLRGAFESWRRATTLRPSLESENPDIQRWFGLEARLPACRAGEDRPSDWREAASFASLELLVHDNPASALRFYRSAMEQNPALVGDIRVGVSYNAACAAVRVGPAEHAAALAWLRADLAALETLLTTDAATVATLLAHWRTDPDLAAIRDAADLPAGIQLLWKEVDTLRERSDR